MQRVFVYGSLLSGLPNHGVLASSRCVCSSARTSSSTLYLVGNGVNFPYLLQHPLRDGHVPVSVEGEVYEVDDATLSRLDTLEGVEGGQYARLSLPVLLDSSLAVDCNVYVCTDPQLIQEIGANPARFQLLATGSWRAHIQMAAKDAATRPFRELVPRLSHTGASSTSAVMRAKPWSRVLFCEQLFWAHPATKSLCKDAWGAYLREEVTNVESLQLFVLALRGSRCEYRHTPICGHDGVEKVVIECCHDTPRAWIVVQTALAVIAGNTTEFTGVATDLAQVLLQGLPSTSMVSFVPEIAGSSPRSPPPPPSASTRVFSYPPGSIVITPAVDGLDHVELRSVLPRLSQLVRREMRPACQAGQAPSDEFDRLSLAERAAHVSARLSHVLAHAAAHSPFYASHCSPPSPALLSSFPIIDGATFSQHVPPYGDAQSTLITSDQYGVSFASGGTTGNMKFVYRAWWEDVDNARLLGKGLMSQGIGPGDVVMNMLAAGFWGGMHVFNAAVSWTGAGLAPVGSSSPHDLVVQFVRKLRPTALIAMPSWVLSFAEHCEAQGITDIAIPKLITGGEMFFPQAADKVTPPPPPPLSLLSTPISTPPLPPPTQVSRILRVTQRLTTGYTSNETGAIAFGCAHFADNTFHLHESTGHLRILDHDGHEVPDGQPGSITFTSLNRALLPIINYQPGDRGRIVPAGEPPCACGRSLRRLQLLGRNGGFIRVGADDLFLETVAGALAEVPRLSLLFTVHVRKSARLRDLIDVHVERAPGADKEREGAGAEAEALADAEAGAALVAALLKHTEFPNLHLIERPVVTVLAPGKLPRNERTGKIVAVVDER